MKIFRLSGSHRLKNSSNFNFKSKKVLTFEIAFGLEGFGWNFRSPFQSCSGEDGRVQLFPRLLGFSKLFWFLVWKRLKVFRRAWAVCSQQFALSSQTSARAISERRALVPCRLNFRSGQDVPSRNCLSCSSRRKPRLQELPGNKSGPGNSKRKASAPRHSLTGCSTNLLPSWKDWNRALRQTEWLLELLNPESLADFLSKSLTFTLD